MKKIALICCFVLLILIPICYFAVVLFRLISNDSPPWVYKLIADELSGPVASPPARIKKCLYRTQITYYVPPRCCDIQSKLYDDSGTYICSPDGGFGGQGDGKCTDFDLFYKSCKQVWVDPRGVID